MAAAVKRTRDRTSIVKAHCTSSTSLESRYSSVVSQARPKVLSSTLVVLERGEQHTCRTFASEATASKSVEAEASDTPPPSQQQEELTFSTPRVQELYERMIKLQKDEVSLVGEIILETLDLTIEPDEFYYYGIGNSGGGGAGKGGSGATAEEAVEEVKKDKFDLKLVGFDAKSKIKVIKEVRSLTGLGLKEAKEMVESAPKVIQKDLKTENAEELMEKLKAAGAEVELV